MKPLVVIGFLGSTLDASKFGPSRWSKWRPSVALTMHEDLRVDRFVMLHGTAHRRLADYCVRLCPVAKPFKRSLTALLAAEFGVIA